MYHRKVKINRRMNLKHSLGVSLKN